MSSTVAKTTKSYTYRSTGGGNADVQIEYSTDLSALSRLEVRIRKWVPSLCLVFFLPQRTNKFLSLTRFVTNVVCEKAKSSAVKQVD